MKKFLLALALYCAIQVNQPTASALPSTPTTISYQGVLTTSTDEVVSDGEYSVTFKLYNTSSGGSTVWTETQTVNTVNGLFNVTLGSIEDITGVEFNGTLYLELTLGGTAMEPRIPFTAQPYSFVAKTLGSTLPITKGGTGATTIEGARANLQLGALAVEDNIINDMWSGEPLSIVNGGTGATTIEDARANLQLGALSLKDYVGNDDWYGPPLSVDNGGTGVNNLDDFKLALDLGTMSSQDADAVDITGGSGAFSDLSSTKDATLNGVVVGKGGSAVSTNTALGNNTLTANTTGANNLAVGQNALATNTTGGGNTAIGRNSMNLNTTGSENTAIGRNSLNKNTTANGNSAIGYYTLRENTTGQFNTAVGTYSEQFNTTGNNNASLGYQALYNNTTGSGNTAVGFTASSANTTGENNTSVGIAAMEKNTTGNRNTALGHQALYGDGGATGSNNTAVGSSALYKNTTGEGNVALGYQAGFGPADENGWSISDNYATFIGYQASRALNVSNTETLENITAIGKNAQVGASNSIVLGGTGMDAVNVGIGLTTPTATLEILKNESQETNPTALKIQNLSASSQSYGIDIDVNGGMAIDITKSSSDVPALRILSESTSAGSSMTINHESNIANALEINYTAMNSENSGLLIGIEDNFGDNNEFSDGRGITIQSYINGDNSKGVYLVMGGEGKDAKGIDINMSGSGAEQKGIYIDLTSGFDFDGEDSRMGAAIGVNDGIGLMVANTNNTDPLTVKIATNNNALEVNGSSSFTGALTLEDENAMIQGAGTGEFLVASAGSLKFESDNNKDITIAPGTGGNLVIPNGAGAGKVLTSDANGSATWENAAGTILSMTDEKTSQSGNITSGSFSLLIESNSLTAGTYLVTTYFGVSANTTSTYYFEANGTEQGRFSVNGGSAPSGGVGRIFTGIVKLSSTGTIKVFGGTTSVDAFTFSNGVLRCVKLF